VTVLPTVPHVSEKLCLCPLALLILALALVHVHALYAMLAPIPVSRRIDANVLRAPAVNPILASLVLQYHIAEWLTPVWDV